MKLNKSAHTVRIEIVKRNYNGIFNSIKFLTKNCSNARYYCWNASNDDVKRALSDLNKIERWYYQKEKQFKIQQKKEVR